MYTDSVDPGGQTPRWVNIDMNEDVTIQVVHDDWVYTCNYLSYPNYKWQLLDIPLVVPLLVDALLQKGGELKRDEDSFAPRASSHHANTHQTPTWDDPQADDNRCFANFVAAQATGALPQQPIDNAVLHGMVEVLAQLNAVFARSRTNVLADARRGAWLGVMLHAGVFSPTGLAGGGLELGYQRFSVELAFGGSLTAFLAREGSELASQLGPELSAMFRARALSSGETWFGLGAGGAKSGGPADFLVNGSYDDPTWLTGELFIEQPFARLGALRLSVGGKHVMDYASCEGAACNSSHTETYFDVALGFVL